MRRRLTFPLQVQAGHLVTVQGDQAVLQSVMAYADTLPATSVLNRPLGVDIDYNVSIETAYRMAFDLRSQIAAYEPTSVGIDVTASLDNYAARINVYWSNTPVLEVTRDD